MSPKPIITAVLIAFVAGSLAYMGYNEFSARNEAPANNDDTQGIAPEFIVYYLSVGKECTTCENIDVFTQEALNTHFADAVQSGRVQWRTHDMDKPEHEHFAEDYNLYTKSIVLVETGSGRFKNLEKVWDHVYDKDTFLTYIRDELQAFMEPAS